MDQVRRMWKEKLGLDLSHLTDDDLLEFGERQARVWTPEDLRHSSAAVLA